MQPILSVYAQYRIIPNLQEHQLRVAAVAQLVCENLAVAVDTPGVVTACLLHDMGNILKFDLGRFPEFTQDQGLAYWEGVRADYHKRYGDDEHAATLAIVRELKQSPVVLSYIDAVGFSRAEDNLKEGNYEKQICEYADQRVGPFGVLSLRERLEEGHARYAGRPRFAFAQDRFEDFAQALQQIEQRLFDGGKLRPDQINDRAIAPVVRQLRTAMV